jgi:REP-associated tyrosine transposase
MAVPKRHQSLPGTYFVTSRTWESRKLFVKREVCQLFVETLLHCRDKGIYRLHGFVLMPEHFHILITPANNTTLERAIQFIKGGSARLIGKELRFTFPVWQRGFSDHRIRDRHDYQEHLTYLEQNPVKRGLCRSVQEYEFSSASGQYALNDIPQPLKPLESFETAS